MLRLVRYGDRGVESVGALVADGIHPLGELLEAQGIDAADDLAVIGALAETARLVASSRIVELIPTDGVRLGPPIRRPGQIIEIGFNTRSLIESLGVEPFAEPSLYAKAPGTVIGPRDPIVLPDRVRKLDYEVELGLVIGAQCKDVPPGKAMDCIAGFVVVNDITARDVQFGEGEHGRYHRQNYRSKSFDTFCPVGPCLYVPDVIDEGYSFTIDSYVNGERRQHGTTDDLIWSVPEIVAFASSSMTLHPGDLILTGGVTGSGYLLDPPTFLQPGDRVVGSISGIGSIDNQVVTSIDN